MKNLTDQAVIDIAKGLIATNGKTTTLEVKQGLRNDGFFATQSEVSTVLDSLYDSEGLEFVNNGTYREYFLAGTAPTPAPVAQRGVTFRMATPKAPKVAAVAVLNPTTNDWEVTDLNKLIVAYYSGISSRGVVRSAFTKTYGANYLDTRATRVK